MAQSKCPVCNCGKFYVKNPDDEYDIYEFDFASQEHRNLTPATPYAILPGYDWSPDGKSIVFCGLKEHLLDLYLINIESEKLTRLTNSIQSKTETKVYQPKIIFGI